MGALLCTAAVAHTSHSPSWALPGVLWQLVAALLDGDHESARSALDAWTRLRATEGAWHTALWGLARQGCADAGVINDPLPRGRTWEAWEIAAAMGGIRTPERRRARRQLRAAFRAEAA